MNAPITVEGLQIVISLLGLFLVGIGALGTSWWNLDSRRREGEKDLHTKLEAKSAELHLRIEQVKSDAVTRDEVDRHYQAISTQNARIESKMDAGFQQIGARVDRLLDDHRRAT